MNEGTRFWAFAGIASIGIIAAFAILTLLPTEVERYGAYPDMQGLSKVEMNGIKSGYHDGWYDAAMGEPSKYGDALSVPEDYSYGYICGYRDSMAFHKLEEHQDDFEKGADSDVVYLAGRPCM